MGDRFAWDVLVDRYDPMVRAVARSLRLADADVADVAQTTWLRLFEHLSTITHPERVGGWLATTARREALRLARRASRELPADDALVDPPASAPAVDHDLLRAEENATVRRAFERLPLRAQLLLTLLIGEQEVTYSDLSRLMDMPIGSIGPTRQRCLDQLRRFIESDGDLMPSEPR